MLLTTTQEIAGHTILQTLGLVTGNIVQSRHIGRDIGAGLKGIIGGELKGYSTMLNDARQEATARMINQAYQLGANAIVGVRYQTNSIGTNSAEVIAYGTAVRI